MNIKKIFRSKIDGVVVVALLLASCSNDILDPEIPLDNGNIVVREVNIRMAEPEVVDVNVLTKTKTYLYSYDTVGIAREHMNGMWHRVGWNAGDKTYCYCQTGVFMDYTLKDEDLLVGLYSGEKAKTHVIYRVGDTWVTCYYKGSLIGNHIGFRKRDNLVLANGVPNSQKGKFEDCHICLTREHPDYDFVFENMQAYLRFEVTESGGTRQGKLLGNYVTKITVHSLSRKDKMAGDLELVDDGGWRTVLVDRGMEADSMITVIPNGGYFQPSPTTPSDPKGKDLSHYFVAVPARRYADGIRLNLYTKVGGVEAIRGYVDVPSTTITRNQILNLHDLLKYCAVYVETISLSYGPDDKVETTGIEMVAGHVGKLVPELVPDTATDQSLIWEVDDATVCTVAQDGSVTALETGVDRDCYITVKAKDRGTVTQKVKINVVSKSSLQPKDYSTGNFGGTWAK